MQKITVFLQSGGWQTNEAGGGVIAAQDALRTAPGIYRVPVGIDVYEVPSYCRNNNQCDNDRTGVPSIRLEHILVHRTRLWLATFVSGKLFLKGARRRAVGVYVCLWFEFAYDTNFHPALAPAYYRLAGMGISIGMDVSVACDLGMACYLSSF